MNEVHGSISLLPPWVGAQYATDCLPKGMGASVHLPCGQGRRAA
ncbi:hypothetical protein RAA17_23510 [Komagataeibacter rhaeticus]|nr:hypothetical protein [Komagataeibacter rhaeticus]